MSGPAKGAIFFDLAETLGVACWSFDGSALGSFTPFPGVAATLQRLQSYPARLGILTVSDQWTEALVRQQLERTGLMPYLEADLVLHWAQDATAQFAYAAALAGFPVDRCEFVSRYESRRKIAQAAGLHVIDVPDLAGAHLDAEAVVRFAATGTWEQLTDLARAHPELSVLSAERDGDVVHLLGAARRAAFADVSARIATREVEGPEWIDSAEIYRASTDSSEATVALASGAEQEGWLLAKRDRAAIFAMPAGTPPTEGLAPAGCDGRLLRLRSTPLSALLAHAVPEAIPVRSLTSDERAALDGLDGERFHKDLIPWWGRFGDPNAPDAIRSRDHRHPHNLLAVDKAARLLASICGAESVHRCVFAGPSGKPLANVRAEIRGTGLSDKIVVVAAHLDSIDAEHPAFDSQEAPGVDDDASGIAGVLSVARTLVELKALDPTGTPRRTIRFLLFNAEEQGLVGSREYIEAHRADQIVAVLQMDMIGFVRSYPAEAVEIHSGGKEFVSGAEASRDLARIVAATMAEVSPSLRRIQLYPLDDCTSDPGGKDSDDTWFRIFGIPACKICEDFYVDECPGKRRLHPTYHSVRDVSVDPNYAAEIARAVAGAAWKIANA